MWAHYPWSGAKVMFPIFKVTIALIALGGVGTALYKAKETPAWAIALAFIVAAGSCFYALPEVVKFIEYVEQRLERAGATVAPSAQPAPPAPPRRNVVQAPRGSRDFCGVDPENKSSCCYDETMRVFIEWEGPYSPYQYANVPFKKYCKYP